VLAALAQQSPQLQVQAAVILFFTASLPLVVVEAVQQAELPTPLL
jgi:hypothetical protein